MFLGCLFSSHSAVFTYSLSHGSTASLSAYRQYSFMSILSIIFVPDIVLCIADTVIIKVEVSISIAGIVLAECPIAVRVVAQSQGSSWNALFLGLVCILILYSWATNGLSKPARRVYRAHVAGSLEASCFQRHVTVDSCKLLWSSC